MKSRPSASELPDLTWRKRALGISAMAVFALVWALMEQLGPQAGVPPLETVWIRYAIQLLLVAAVCVPRPKAPLIRKQGIAAHIIRATMMLGMPLFFLAAVSRLPLTSTLAVFWICPALLAAIDTPFLALVGYVGVILILAPRGNLFRFASLLPLGMGACFVVYQILTRRMPEEARSAKLFQTALWVFVPLTVRMPFLWRTPTLHGFAAIASIGVLGTVGLYALDVAVELLSPVALGITTLLQPVGTCLLDSLVSHKFPRPSALTGCAMVIVSMVLSNGVLSNGVLSNGVLSTRVSCTWPRRLFLKTACSKEDGK